MIVVPADPLRHCVPSALSVYLLQLDSRSVSDSPEMTKTILVLSSPNDSGFGGNYVKSVRVTVLI